MSHHHHDEGMSHDKGVGAHGSVFSFSMSTATPLLFAGLHAGPDFLSFAIAVLVLVGMGIGRQELVRLSELETNAHGLRSAYFFAQALISYLLMLVAMSFNAYLFLAVLAGLTIGHYRMLRMQIKPPAKEQDCCA